MKCIPVYETTASIIRVAMEAGFSKIGI